MEYAVISGDFKSRSSGNHIAPVFRSPARLLGLTLIILTVLVGTYGLLTRPSQALASVQSKQPVAHVQAPNPAPQTAPATTATVTATTPSSSTPPPSVATPVAAVTPPACAPDNTYALPTSLDLTNQADGFTQVTDPASRYVVYGNSSAQIHAQLRQCAPSSSEAGDAFAAETSYKLSWQYGSTPDTAGNCTLTDVKVGLHLNMVLPQWQPTGSSATGLATEWQSFISNLTVHENGHVAIDQQYAQQLLSDLQNYPSTACSAIAGAVQGRVAADVAALNAANDVYDARTNHGATQGAILP